MPAMQYTYGWMSSPNLAIEFVHPGRTRQRDSVPFIPADRHGGMPAPARNVPHVLPFFPGQEVP